MVFHIGITCVLGVSLGTQIAKVATTKSEQEQRDQEASTRWTGGQFQSPHLLGQRIRLKLHGLTRRAFRG
jgi:hypothetical protein